LQTNNAIFFAISKMGNTVSQLSGRLTEDIVRDRTKNYTTLFSHIFNFMIKKLNITDVVSLQDSNKCKEYIVFMGDALMRFFNQFYIDIGQNKKGMIFFKKVSDLQRETEGTRKQYCEKIAFFYIRIFQIYSALALSVIDESFVPSESPVGQGGIPGARPTGVPFRGGDSLKKDFIRELKDSTKLKDIRKVKLTFSSDDIIINNRYKFYYEITDDKNGKKYKLNIKQVFKNANGTAYSPLQIQPNFFKKISFNIDEHIATILEDYFYDNISFLENYVGYPQTTYMQNPLYRNPRDPRDPRYHLYTERQPELRITNSRVDALKTKKYYDIFAKTIVIKPYCVSRAMQLLRQDPGAIVSGPVFTEICNTSFGESLGDSYMVPKKDGNISKSVGLSSLAVLFYDVIKNTTPSMSNESEKEYIEFIKNMALAFNDRDNHKDYKKSSDLLNDIKARLPANCKNIKFKATVSNKDAIAGTNMYINSMFKHQIEHAGRAALIIDKLFQREKDGSIYLNKNAEAGGMRYLNAVAEQAKQLLTIYYTKCEGLYALASDGLANRGEMKAV